MNSQIEQLSVEFSKVLKSWLTACQMKEVVRINNTPGNEAFCASHNFCDANMAMDEAFEKVFGREFIFHDEEKPETLEGNARDTDIFNEAWDLAKKNNFYLDQKF